MPERPSLLLAPKFSFRLSSGHRFPSADFSTLARWDWHSTPPTCYYMKDREIFSDAVRRKKGVIFLDVRETMNGERYIKLTERNREKSMQTDYLYVGMDDFPQFFKSLKAIDGGKDVEELQLSGEGFHIACDRSDVRVSKHRLDGKNSVIILSLKELKVILRMFERIQKMKVDTSTITLSRREAGAIQGAGGQTRKEIEKENTVRIKIAGKKEDQSREVFISGSGSDIERAKETINEILTFESLIVAREEAGVLLGADGGPRHIFDIESQSNTVIEVQKGGGRPPRILILGRKEAKTKAVELIKEFLLQSKAFVPEKVDARDKAE